MSRGEAYVEAYVSLATNDSYAMGALVLAKSIRDSGSSRRLALMVSSGISQEMRQRLSKVWDELIDIELLDSGDAEHLSLLARPELGVTFSKINAWRLCQYAKCVFLDADTLVLQNVDELFDRDELSAAPDIGWPDCFNSGVFVFEPSLETFRNLMDLARQTGSFDGGDQGLLNLYWSDWATKDIRHHLPFTFNVTPNITYGYAPAFQKFGRDVKIIHFIGSIKPWQHRYLKEVDAVILHPGTYAAQNAAQDYIRRWWQVYTSLEQPWVPPEIHYPPCDVHHHHLTPRYPPTSHRPAQSRSHSPSASRPVYLSPNLGTNSNTGTSRSPYLHPGEWGGSGYSSHSISPLDSESQIIDHFHGPGGFASRYMHSISPHDSVRIHSPLRSDTSPPNHRNGTKSPSPKGLISPLSHEDVHSHISLSFYGENSFFDRISSLSHTEPRTYYIDDAVSCDSEQAAEADVEKSASCISVDGSGGGEDDLGSSASTWSLNHFNPPSFHTPSSILYPIVPPSIALAPSDDTFGGHSWGHDIVVDSPWPPTTTWASTEGDEVTCTYTSAHDGHVISPALPSQSGGGEAGDGSCDYHVTVTTMTPVPPPPSSVLTVERNREDGDSTVLSSDLVLPIIHTSLPPPTSPSLPPIQISSPQNPPPPSTKRNRQHHKLA